MIRRLNLCPMADQAGMFRITDETETIENTVSILERGNKTE